LGASGQAALEFLMKTSIKVLVLVERHEAVAVRPQQQSFDTVGEAIEARPIRRVFPTNVTAAPFARALLSLDRWLRRAS
jgi:hypothetical protein